MDCQYCGNDYEDNLKKCPTCGAPKSKNGAKPEAPNLFYFHGFLIQCEWNGYGRERRYHVFEGERLVSQFEIGEEYFQEFARIHGEGVDTEPLLYKFLRLAIGDTEVERIETMNMGIPATVFEIRRLERQWPQRQDTSGSNCFAGLESCITAGRR